MRSRHTVAAERKICGIDESGKVLSELRWTVVVIFSVQTSLQWQTHGNLIRKKDAGKL